MLIHHRIIEGKETVTNRTKNNDRPIKPTESKIIDQYR